MSLKAEVKISGDRELRENLKKLRKTLITRAIRPGMVRTSAQALSDAKELAPIDIGRLRANTILLPPVAKFFGGSLDEFNAGFVFRQKYAAAQHENLQFAHPGGGEAKYAEKALQKNQANFVNGIGQAVRGLLGR